MAKPTKFPRVLSRFLRGQDGSSTVESIIWIPVFVFLLGLIADTSLMFGNQAEVLRVVQDANRSLSLGRIMSTDEAETFITDRIARLSPNATVTTTVLGGVIHSVVDMPSSDLTATGFFSGFATITLRVQSYHLSEA